MKDLDKLNRIYWTLDRTLRDIEDVGELRDYDLDCEVQKIYDKIDDAHIDFYGLIEEMENI